LAPNWLDTGRLKLTPAVAMALGYRHASLGSCPGQFADLRTAA